ncbi:P-selectin isoform X3 [Lates calcarifer]|uniref:P-selectin isoform X3 n=1 Tax=Lates calcarifer TaxID=8187 RepID=A0AAJ8DVU2_LATCA|nr:P-selectin isoform X3 [Lates calcarifer]XP_050932938.1 P-selectin isoform X3 [Lates calcarifer]
MKWTLILLFGSSLAVTTLGWTYHYSNKAMDWAQARQFCQENYTDMVVIQSQRENDHLVSLLPNRISSPYYWIGITKNHKNETWRWIGNNSTWIGNQSWAEDEPNNNYSNEFCVEIYVNKGKNRGKWNDEKCSNPKYAVCYKSQCTESSCVRGTCHETVENTTCLCEPGFKGDRCQTAQCTESSCVRGTCHETIENTTCLCEPGFKGDRCQTAVQCPHPSDPLNGVYSCREGNQTFNSTCQLKCHLFVLVIGSSAITCGATGVWSGPRPTCTIYKQALMAVSGCGAVSAFCCICLCWMKHRKRKKLTQVRQPEEVTSPFSEVQG